MKKYAFLPGALMALAGVLWAALTLEWNTASITLAAGGALALAVGLAVTWQEIREWFRDPRGVFAVNTALSCLLLVAILGMLNASAALRPVTFDLTSSGRNTLAIETRNILQKLPGDVALKQFGRTPDPRVDQLLASMARESSRVKSQFVDAEKSLQQAREYGVLRNGTVIVEYGAKYRKIEQVTEPALVTAVLQVTSTVEPLVCLAQGDGERGFSDEGSTGLSMWVAAIKASNYRADPISLTQQDVPRLCTVVVVAGMADGFGQARLDRLGRFLITGGRIAFLIDPPVDAVVSTWLRPYGIGVGDGIAIDNSSGGRSVGTGPEMLLGVSYNNHPVTRGFGLATIYDRAAPLRVERQDVGKPVPLVATGAGSFEKLDLTSQSLTFREGRDRPGPLTMAIAATIPRGAQDAVRPEPRIVAFGDSDWVTNANLGRQGNRDLALRMIAWLAGDEEAHVVAAGDRENRRISMTERMRTSMYVVNLLLLPAIPFVAGVVRLLRARK
jgi:ABC-type uncharacterized transport system involved in gliding motility auxiliary subunit